MLRDWLPSHPLPLPPSPHPGMGLHLGLSKPRIPELAKKAQVFGAINCPHSQDRDLNLKGPVVGYQPRDLRLRCLGILLCAREYSSVSVFRGASGTWASKTAGVPQIGPQL